MKSKETILKEAYSKIEGRQVADSEVEVILLSAMEEYHAQFSTPISENEIKKIEKKIVKILYRYDIDEYNSWDNTELVSQLCKGISLCSIQSEI